MPQPVKPSSWRFPNRVLLERPKLAAIIGAIACEWTGVETSLTFLIANGFGVHEHGRNGKRGFQTNMLAKAAMDAAETIRSRLRLMDATLGKLVQGTLLASEWAEIKRDLQARSKERNRLVHGFWMISDDFPNDLLLYNDQNRSMHKYTEADLMNTLDRIVATRRSCHALLDKIVEALRVGALTPSALGPIGVEL